MPTKHSRSRGRPRCIAANKLTETLGVRLAPADRDTIRAKAAESGMKESDWAREVLLGKRPSTTSMIVKAQALQNLLKRMPPGSPNAVDSWNDFLAFYRDCEQLVRRDPLTLTSNVKKADASKVSALINAFRLLSKSVRQLAVERKTPALIHELVNSCMLTCHTLARPSLREDVTQVASDHAYFPVLAYAQPMLNRRSTTFLKTIGLGKRVQGVRSEAKSTDDAFFHNVFPLLDHIEALIIAWKLKTKIISPGAVSGARSAKPRVIYDAENCLKTLDRFVSGLQNRQRVPKSLQDETWKVVDQQIIGHRKQSSHDLPVQLRFDRCWEDFFEDEDLINEVAATCSGRKRTRGAEIKKRVRQKFFVIFDRYPSSLLAVSQSLKSKAFSASPIFVSP